MRKKKTKISTEEIKYPFSRLSSGINCTMRPFWMQHRPNDSFSLVVFKSYLELLCNVFYTTKLESEKPNVRAGALKQINLLIGHLTAMEVQDKKQIAFGGAEPKAAAMYHANKFSGLDFTTAAFNSKVTVIDPKSLPVDRDVTGSPAVRITFEPLRKRETAVFQEELESISAFQLGQRIVSKRYQFNGVHANYLHSKMIVTETPEEKRVIPNLDVPEIVEDPSDPSTWLVQPDNFVSKDQLGKLVNKFNAVRFK